MFQQFAHVQLGGVGGDGDGATSGEQGVGDGVQGFDYFGEEELAVT
jgi:hypothetical protein